MKIGLVCADPLSLPGGIQDQVKGLYKFLKSKKYDVKIIAPRYKKNEKHGKDVILLGTTTAFEYGNGSKANWSMIYDNEELENILKKEKFDILHFHSIGIFSTLQILRKSTSKNVLTYHILPETSMTYKVFSHMMNYFMRDYLDKFNKGTVPSKPVLKYLMKDYIKTVQVIPNGIDTTTFKPSNKKIEKFKDGKLNILFVGRMDKRKGLGYLLKAYKNLKTEHPNIRLIVVGEGYSKENHENFVEENKLEDVVFTGYVSDKDLPQYYATCDLFCAPTVSDESFGLTIGEAMATGKPVVATDITGYREVYGESKGIAFAKPKNATSLSKEIDRLIEDEKLRRKMGNYGLITAQKYSWDRVGNQFLKMYSGLGVSKNQTPPSIMGIGMVMIVMMGIWLGWAIVKPFEYIRKLLNL